MAKFRVETELTVAKGGGDAAKQEFKKVSDGARQASIDVKDLTKSIGAGISIYAIARQNLQALAPVLERNGQLFRSMAVSWGADAGAVNALTLAMDSLIHPSKIIENGIKATELGSKKLQEAWVGETEVVLNLSQAQLKAVDSYLAMGGAAGLAARLQAKAAKEQQDMVDHMEQVREEYQRNEERAAEERKSRNEEYRRELQAIIDRLNPVAAAERDLQHQIDMVSAALAAGGPNANTYRDALASLRAELDAVQHAADLVAQTIPTIDMGPRQINTDLPSNPFTGGSMTIEQIETAASRYEDAMTEAGKNFSSSLEQGMTSAIASAMSEFLHTGELNVKALGQMLLDTLLNAAAEYFAQMVVNQAKLKMSNSVSGTNGTSTTGSAMSALGNVALAAAVVYAVVEITKGIKAANDAGKFKETAAAGVYRGGVGSTYAGELSAQGRQMADALRGFLNLMQSVAGSWITQMGEIGVRVSGDGKKFQAMVGGEIIGTFKSMSEAMVRAFQAAFKDATFASEIDPIIRDMVTNFRGTDIEELKKGLVQVKQMLNEVSGLSDIEIAIKDLPFQADALKQSMVQLGASFEDASALAAKWQATQMMGLRDQITGHQATEAEQRAQKEREALLFNAQLALNKAEITMRRDKLAADIEILKAGGSLATADLNLTTQYLGQVGNLTEVKAQLLNQDLQIQQGHVNLMTAAGQAALASLQLQLDALNQVYAILDSIKPINLAEIHIGGGHGGGGGANIATGPTPAEIDAQLAADIATFWQDIADGWRSMLPELSQRIANLNHWYEQQAARAEELGIPLDQLNELYRAQLDMIRDEIANGFGSPMEGARDQAQEIKDRVAAWFESGQEIVNRYLAGEIGDDELFAALDHANQLWAEFGQAAEATLMNMALYFTDALGDTEESARIRAELAELEWDFKKMEMELMIQTFAEAGLLSKEAQERWQSFIDGLPENLPVTPTTTTTTAEPIAELLAKLGLESVATAKKFDDLREALNRLNELGAISAEQMRELGDSMYVSLVDSLLQYVDNEDVRRQLEDLRFRMEIANYQLQFQYLIQLGLLTQAEIDVINGLFADIQDAYDNGQLHFQLPDVNQTQNNGGNAADEARNAAEQALREALDRLRGAVESLQEFQKGLTLSSSSPLTTSQQFQEAARQYADLLAAAQGGDIGAMEQLAAAAQTYLNLAAEMFGTSGAGYAAIFDAVSQQVAAIAAMGQQILDSVPPQMAGTEDRLDTIADILRVMAGLGAGGTGGGGNSHAGLVYYGPDWGWHPMGWSPGGNTPPGTSNLAAASLGSAGNLSLGNFSQPGAVTVRAPELVAKIDQLVTAHQAATVEAKNDRMKKTTPSWSGYHGQPIGSRRSA